MGHLTSPDHHLHQPLSRTLHPPAVKHDVEKINKKEKLCKVARNQSTKASYEKA